MHRKLCSKQHSVHISSVSHKKIKNPNEQNRQKTGHEYLNEIGNILHKTSNMLPEEKYKNNK